MKKKTIIGISKLVAAAGKVRDKAYAPYSNFKVGAAVLGVNGKIYSGCNVESVSYGLTICAERNALAAAVADGCRKMTAVAVVAGSKKLVFPCGACLQVLNEFCGPETVVALSLPGNNKTVSIFTLAELMPHAFDGRDVLPAKSQRNKPKNSKR